ncbi:MAG: YHS domain-containing (seleno)protein [Acidobacteriota bacterium]
MSFKHFLAALLAFAVTVPVFAVDPVYTARFSDVAIRGYDTVAYFSEGKPVKGSDDFVHSWKGAEWRFASAENRDLFAANPDEYAPQYGGYCAYAVSQNSTAGIDPDAWSIVDGKLYLNYNAKIQKQWEANRAEFISLADENWPGLVDK